MEEVDDLAARGKDDEFVVLRKLKHKETETNQAAAADQVTDDSLTNQEARKLQQT